MVWSADGSAGSPALRCALLSRALLVCFVCTSCEPVVVRGVGPCCGWLAVRLVCMSDCVGLDRGARLGLRGDADRAAIVVVAWRHGRASMGAECRIGCWAVMVLLDAAVDLSATVYGGRRR